MGARSGGGGGSRGGVDRNGNGPVGRQLKKLATDAMNAFNSKGVSDYFNGSNSADAVKAYNDYQTKMNAFKSAYEKATGGDGAAGDDWSALASDFSSGEVGLRF